MVVTNGKAIFIYGINYSSFNKYGGPLLKVFDTIGANKVVQELTDNVSNHKAIGHITESTYSHIFWS